MLINKYIAAWATFKYKVKLRFRSLGLTNKHREELQYIERTKSSMVMYICLRCCGVSTYPKGTCCNQKVEVFAPAKHGDLLTGMSNAWLAVDNKWKNEPLLKEATEELIRDGCFSSSTIFNEFIQKLKDKIEELEFE